VKWSATLSTTDITGNVAFGGYIPSDASNDLGGINLSRSNQNGGSPFNARFAGIHAMNVKVYSSVSPGPKQSGDPTAVTVGSSSYPFDAAYLGNVVVYESLMPQYANVTVGSSSNPFGSMYTSSISVASSIVPATNGVTVGTINNPLSLVASVNGSISNLVSSNAITGNLTISGNGTNGSAVILPNANQVYDIGVSGLQFGNVWANTGNFNNINLHGVPIMQVIAGDHTVPWTSLYNIPPTLYGMGITQVPWAMITNPPVVAPAGFDIPFTAGFTPDFNLTDLKIQPYGQVVLARNIVIQGEVSVLQRVSTGADLILDILKNGSSVYTSKPIFSAGSSTLTPGVLDASARYCNASDIIQFVVVQIGSMSAGAGVNFTIKGHEA